MFKMFLFLCYCLYWHFKNLSLSNWRFFSLGSILFCVLRFLFVCSILQMNAIIEGKFIGYNWEIIFFLIDDSIAAPNMKWFRMESLFYQDVSENRWWSELIFWFSVKLLNPNWIWQLGRVNNAKSMHLMCPSCRNQFRINRPLGIRKLIRIIRGFLTSATNPTKSEVKRKFVL